MLKQIDQRTVSDNKSEFNADAIIKELENIQQYDQNTINTLRRIFNQIRQHISPTNIDRLEVLSQFCRTSWFFLHYVKPENKFNDDITNFSREVLDYLLRVLSSSDFYNFNNGDTYDNQRLFTDTFYEVLDLSSLIFTLINDERKARTFIDILIRNQHNITQSSLYTPSRFSENLLGIVNIAYTTNEAKQQFLLSLLENLKYDLLLSMINNLLADKQFWENSTELKGIFAESLFLQIFDHYKHAYNEHNENLKFLYSQIINRLIEESQEAVDNIVRILKSGKKDDIEPLIDLLENVKVSELRIKSHTKTNLEQLVSVIKDLFADVFINRKINLNSESQKLLLLKRLWVESTGTIYEFISNSILRNCSVEMMAIAYGYMLNIVVEKDIDKVIDFF
ncbi:MAG: hypothetical protein N3E37_03280 [Candidatus Micrarchaeota archaeon]|nr:hypothetical protein [Candidatus Micrarchaeota archaeon]